MSSRGSDIPGGSVRKMRVAKESMDTGVVRTHIYGVWALSASFVFIDVRLTSTCGLRHRTATQMKWFWSLYYSRGQIESEEIHCGNARGTPGMSHGTPDARACPLYTSPHIIRRYFKHETVLILAKNDVLYLGMSLPLLLMPITRLLLLYS